MTRANISKHSRVKNRDGRLNCFINLVGVFFYLSVLLAFFLLLILISCRISRVSVVNPFKSEPFESVLENESVSYNEDSRISKEDVNENGTAGRDLALFDYTKIKIEPTESIDVKIKNCNLFLDIYGDILILGEMINVSRVVKTNIQITFNFYDASGAEIDYIIIPAYAGYLREKAFLPFYIIYENRHKYIDIARVKIGVNYNNYKESLTGNPVVTIGSFFYRENKLIIKGSVENIGQNSIEDLKLFLTLYDFKNKVVSIKQCFLARDKLEELGKEEFEVNVLLDEYLKDFTHYHIEAFFRDSLKV